MKDEKKNDKYQEFLQQNVKDAKRELKNQATGVAGLAGITGGGALVDSIHKKGDITGVRKFYHNAERKNIPSILKEGLKGSKASDPNNLTNTALGDSIRRGNIKKEDIANKVYLGKNRYTSLEAGTGRVNVKTPGLGFTDLLKENHKQNKTLNVNIPLEDLKKMKSAPNPEMLGATNVNDFVKKWRKANPYSIMADEKLKSLYNNMGKGTHVVEGDVASKYIKGSKNYQRQTLKGLARHMKKNPGQFAKGVGLTGVGLGALGAGGYGYYKSTKDNISLNKERKKRQDEYVESLKQKFKQKKAYEMVDEAFNKIAKEIYY